MLPSIQALQENEYFWVPVTLYLQKLHIAQRWQKHFGWHHTPLIQIFNFLGEAIELRSSMEIQVRRTEQEPECKCKALAQ